MTSARKRRFIPEFILIAVVAALVARFSATTQPEVAFRNVNHPDLPPPPQTRSQWSVDRVTPGMNYEEVVSRLGPPTRIKNHWEGWLSLHWGEENTVYFNQGIAYACFGSRLYKSSKEIDVTFYDTEGLERALGPSTEGERPMFRWWPAAQIGTTYQAQLLQVAPSVREPPQGKRFSWGYPWSSEWRSRWVLDDLEPGQSLGYGHTWPQIQWSRSGFITELSGKKLELYASLGHHQHYDGPFNVGDRISQLKRWTPTDASRTRFYSEDGNVEAECRDGIITNFHLRLNQPELIEVLDRHTR